MTEIKKPLTCEEIFRLAKKEKTPPETLREQILSEYPVLKALLEDTVIQAKYARLNKFRKEDEDILAENKNANMSFRKAKQDEIICELSVPFHQHVPGLCKALSIEGISLKHDFLHFLTVLDILFQNYK